jgi:hypothetical protein
VTAGAAVWWALVAVEVAALVLAVRVGAMGPGSRKNAGDSHDRNPQVRVITAGRDGARLQVRPLAALLFVALANEVTIEAIRLHLAPVPRPFAGLHLALYHLSNGLVLAWPAALAVASWRCFSSPRWDHRRRRIRRPVPAWWAGVIVAGCWCGFVLALVVAYPLGRESTARVLGAFEGGTVVAALAPIPLGWRKPWGVAHVGVGLLVAVEVAIAMIGPWVRDVFTTWNVASAGYLAGFGALAAYLGAMTLRAPRHGAAKLRE